MTKFTDHPFAGRALGRCCVMPLTLFFYFIFSEPLSADTGTLDTALSSYIANMALMLCLIFLLGYLGMKYLPKRFRSAASGKLKLLGAMPLGRDIVYLIRIGPDVVSIYVARGAVAVVGRWSVEEWERFDAENDKDHNNDHDKKIQETMRGEPK